MAVEIRPITEEQWPDYIRAAFVPFGEAASDQDVNDSKIEFEPERSIAAFDGDRIVGNTSVITLRMTVPGGAEALTAGVTTVGVSPTHRRRGILRRMMRHQSDASREQGYPLAALWASEPAIYQRFGYGMATRQTACGVPRAHTAWLRPAGNPGQVRLIGSDDVFKELNPLYDRLRGETPGMLERNEEWWKYRFAHLDAEHHRGGFGPLQYALHDGPEGPDAYAVYRQKGEHQDDGIDRGIVQVVEAVTTTADSVRGMWTYLFGIDLVETIDFWNRPPDDPMFSMVLDLRRFGPRTTDGLWLRLLDVPAALSTRRYGAEGRVLFELQDEFCDWNSGTYELTGGPDGAECSRTDADPELSLTMNELGAAYLGGTRLRTLTRAGRVTEHTDGAVARADAMFAGDREPWCPHQF